MVERHVSEVLRVEALELHLLSCLGDQIQSGLFVED